MKIEQKLKGFKKNILLKNYTTFKIGGSAKYFFVARTKEDLIKAIQKAKALKLPFFILGGGSNVLVNDSGYKGLVIKMENIKYKLKNKNLIYAESGSPFKKIVKFASNNSLTGLEWAAGIPGTIGAAVYGNVAAFGLTIMEAIKSIEALDIKKMKFKNLSRKKINFGNKDSLFKKNKNLIIISIVLKLKKGNSSKIKNKIKEVLNYRKKRHPLNFPSAGCIFKNPSSDSRSAGELIDKCGLKGKTIGGAKISEKHANFIINTGRARAEDVVKLIKIIKNKVRRKFGIKLEEEIQYLGF